MPRSPFPPTLTIPPDQIPLQIPPKKMCLFWTVKYLCNCIYDEWYQPCRSNADDSDQPRQQKTWCYKRNIQEITDVLTLCEACYAKVDARVRKDGLKKVLQSAETFPLAGPLGMLVALENDEHEQWKAFGRERRVLLLEGEWYIPGTEGPVDSGRLKLK